jgi:DNA invertase Pin-like site-specific DNA recombinase
MMHPEDHALDVRAVGHSGSQERPLALGYGSVRSPARIDDPAFARQETLIERFCVQRGWEVVALLRDVEMQKTRACARPALIYAIERLGRGDAGCLVVAELSRLSPSVAELGWILEAIEQVNGRLISLNPAVDTTAPVGRAVARALVSVSSWERTRRAEMTSAARSKVVPFPRTIQPKLRRRIVRMRGAGLTLQAIADVLNEEDVPTVRGGARWRPSSVQTALGYKRPDPWTVTPIARASRRAERGAA